MRIRIASSPIVEICLLLLLALLAKVGMFAVVLILEGSCYGLVVRNLTTIFISPRSISCP